MSIINITNILHYPCVCLCFTLDYLLMFGCTCLSSTTWGQNDYGGDKCIFVGYGEVSKCRTLEMWSLMKDKPVWNDGKESKEKQFVTERAYTN